jgi:acetyl-CoA/propionyl-CoA carboxylase biotin carboxyl carrier protein
LVEETPPPLFGELVGPMGEAAVRVANACGYENAGTVEFLVDTETRGGAFYFLEINARLQVEHTITETVLGIDLVAEQLRIASGDPLGFEPATLSPRGHAIECRINAENPAKKFFPSPGRITAYREPAGPGIRVDSGFGEGDEVPQAYDSLLAKLIVSAPDRERALQRMLDALDRFHIEGIATTIQAHRILLREPSFVDGTYTTRTVDTVSFDTAGPQSEPLPAQDGPMGEGGTARLWHPAVAPFVSAGGGTVFAGGGAVAAPMHGTILKVLVAPGDRVEPGDPVAVLEAMKMETFLSAPAAGTIAEVRAKEGDVVEAGEIVAVLEKS